MTLEQRIFHKYSFIFGLRIMRNIVTHTAKSDALMLSTRCKRLLFATYQLNLILITMDVVCKLY